MAVDWLTIRNDYINGGGSYRKLAEKYGITLATIRRRAEAENWIKLREEHQHKINTKAAQKRTDGTPSVLFCISIFAQTISCQNSSDRVAQLHENACQKRCLLGR